MAVFGDSAPCVGRSPRSTARDMLEADAYLQRSLECPFHGPSRICFQRRPGHVRMPDSQADAAQCGNSSAGFDAWKQEFAGEARAKGVSASTIQALMATNYAQATINADRGQRSFNLSLDQFLAKRGGTTIVARGRSAEGVAGRAVRLHPAALRRAAGAAARDLGHGDGLWQPARQSEHAVVDCDARL